MLLHQPNAWINGSFVVDRLSLDFCFLSQDTLYCKQPGVYVVVVGRGGFGLSLNSK
jgi:hypothetical protein